MSATLIPTPEEFAQELARVAHALVAAGPERARGEIEIFAQDALLNVQTMIAVAVREAIAAERTRVRDRAERYLEAIGEGPFSPSARTVADVALSIRLDEMEVPQ